MSLHKKLIDVIRFVIISPELVMLLIVLLLVERYPVLIYSFGRAVSLQSQNIQYIALLPLALLAVAYRQSKEVLKPSTDVINKMFYLWPDYWKFKMRVLTTVYVNFLASIVTVLIWIYSTNLNHLYLGAGLMCAILISAISTASQYLAYFRLREILETNKSN